MRIATANTYDAAIAFLQKRQQEMSESQIQLTSGKRVNNASDDPTAAARAERALAQEARVTANQRAVDASRNAMTLGESALGDSVDLLQEAREALVNAGNATYTDAERKNLAQSLREMRNQLFAIANRTDGSGGYLFGGQGASSPPFVDTPSGVQYRGTGGQTNVASGESLPITLDGPATWLAGRTGNGVFETRAVTQNGSGWIDSGRVSDPSALTGDPYTIDFTVSGGTTTYTVLRNGNPTALTNVPYVSGQSIEIDGMAVAVTGAPANGDQFALAPSSASLNVFEVLDRTAAALETPLLNNGQVSQAVNNGLRDIDAALGQLQQVRAAAGETLNRIDGVESRLSALKLGAKTERSNAEDLDMVDAISKFQQQQSGYEAALQSYSMVQQLSLFKFIS